MKNWIIKFLGGFTSEQVHLREAELMRICDVNLAYRDRKIYQLTANLAKSSKNDTPRDRKTGRFIKK